jgi:hypothetical protein
VTAVVVSLDAARRQRALTPRDAARPQAEIRGDRVAILACSRDALMTPAATRTYGRALLALADSAETGRPLPPLIDPESTARLELLARELDALDRGEKRLSDVLWLLRQLTSEVRRG